MQDSSQLLKQFFLFQSPSQSTELALEELATAIFWFKLMLHRPITSPGLQNSNSEMPSLMDTLSQIKVKLPTQLHEKNVHGQLATAIFQFG